ncbi:MAG: Gfo/Idh/MocA family oxidoreductase [Tepidisphaeraceae bacterium]
MQIHRLAFIGVRGHISTVLRELPNHPAVRIVGYCDGGGEPADPIRTWCQQHGHHAQPFDHYLRMFDEAKPQAVVICGAFDQHAQMAIDAIERGIHVLTEKPAALTFDDLHRLSATHAAFPEVHLSSLQTARHQKSFYTAWKLVREGAIGDVRLINARKSYRRGVRGPFYDRRETYGGTIPWVGSHAIDWMLWIGGHAVRSAYATHSTIANGGHGTMESTAACHFNLCGERVATISIDVLRPANAPTHGDDWLRVVGTDGVLQVTANDVHLINDQNDGVRPVALETVPTLLEDFLAQIEGRATTLNPTADVFATTAACLLARQAADEQRVIEAGELTSVRIKAVRTEPRPSQSLPPQITVTSHLKSKPAATAI